MTKSSKHLKTQKRSAFNTIKHYLDGESSDTPLAAPMHCL